MLNSCRTDRRELWTKKLFLYWTFVSMHCCIIVIARVGVKFGINSTRCTKDGKIAILGTHENFYPKFHSCPCYYIIYKHSTVVGSLYINC